jgi:hypothetical protein
MSKTLNNYNYYYNVQLTYVILVKEYIIKKKKITVQENFV